MPRNQRFRTNTRRALAHAVWVLLVALCMPCSLVAQASPSGTGDAGWPVYGGDAGGTRFSAAKEITPANVRNLRQAWVFHTHALDHDRPDIKDSSFETTPVLLDRTLYLTSPFDEVFALDAITGAELWNYDPRVSLPFPGVIVTSRGVAAWQAARIATAGSTAPPCQRRIFLGTLDARLIALDAASGKPCATFGQGGTVDLKQGVHFQNNGGYEVTSPPAVVGNVVVVGSAVSDNQQADPESGVVRGFDAVTGRLLWEWEPLPWASATHPRTGAGNVWSVIAADPATGLVFLPTSSPSPDFYGSFRPGDNRDADSVVALDAATGEKVWAFQTVHHDLWDYDVPAEPVLFDMPGPQGTVPAVAVNTKLGQVFLLDRRTGAPLAPVTERHVAASGIPGETASPTQPFSSVTLTPMEWPGTENGGWHREPKEAAYCNQQIAALRYQGPFTPPGTTASLLYPSNVGGVNWGGAAYDPARHLMYANVNREVFSLQLHRRYGLRSLRFNYEPFFRDWPVWVCTGAALLIGNILLRLRRSRLARKRHEPGLALPWLPSWSGALLAMGIAAIAGIMCLFPASPYVAHFGHEISPQRGTPYIIEREPIFDHHGNPCVAPPWGATVALDVVSGKLAWQTPLGSGVAGEHTGSPAFGGPIVSAGGLLFTGGTQDAQLRALDAGSGQELWQGQLPASARATPMTYQIDGRQYVVVAAGGHTGLRGKTGDAVVAFALP